MNTLRQRNPFKFPEEEPDESRILDEQEQEEIIESLRSANHASTTHHYKFLQGCLSFMIIFHVWFIVTPRNLTPVHLLLPYSRTPRAPLIPFSTGFALLNIALLLNVVLHLPDYLSFPRFINSLLSQTMRHLPLHIQRMEKSYLPLPIRWAMGLLSVPAFVSVLTLRDIHQILWWTSPLIVVGGFSIVVLWIQENEAELNKLEKLKYEAKGA